MYDKVLGGLWGFQNELNRTVATTLFNTMIDPVLASLYNKEKKIYDNDVRVRGLRSTAPFLLFKAGVQCQERWVSCFFSLTYRRCEFGSIELNKYILCTVVSPRLSQSRELTRAHVSSRELT